MKKLICVVLMFLCSMCYCFADDNNNSNNSNNFNIVPYYQFQVNTNWTFRISYILIEGHLWIFVRESNCGGGLIHSERCLKCKAKAYKSNN